MSDEFKHEKVSKVTFKIDGLDKWREMMEDPAYKEALLKASRRVSSDIDSMLFNAMMPLRGVEVVPDKCSPPTHVFERGKPRCKCGVLEA